MNHRTGRLTWRDFEPSESQPAPTFFTGPIEHTSDFGVLQPGRTFHVPSRVQAPSPAQRQARTERLQAIAFAVFLVLLGAWVLFDRLSS